MMLRRFEVYKNGLFEGHGVQFEDGAIAMRIDSEVINILDDVGAEFFIKAAPTAGVEVRWLDE